LEALKTKVETEEKMSDTDTNVIAKEQEIQMSSKNEDVLPILEELRAQWEELKPVETVSAEHRNYHAGVSKLTKTVDKVVAENKATSICWPEMSSAAESKPCANENLMDMEKENENEAEKTIWCKEEYAASLDTLVVGHLYQRGAFLAAKKLVEEGHVSVKEESYKPLVKLHSIIKAMNSTPRELGPAREWVESNKEKLKEIGSSLDIDLVRLEFLLILQSNDPKTQIMALKFAQKNFPKYATSNYKDIKQMMGLMVWAGMLDKAPYPDLLSPQIWLETESHLLRDGCRLAGLPPEGLLQTCLEVGADAIPTLIKMLSVVKASNRDWKSLEELPAEIPLRPECQFHSVFSCPVSRELATKDNPPTLLKCGHMVLRSSAEKLVKANGRLKCPTCPTEQTSDDIKDVFI